MKKITALLALPLAFLLAACNSEPVKVTETPAPITSVVTETPESSGYSRAEQDYLTVVEGSGYLPDLSLADKAIESGWLHCEALASGSVEDYVIYMLSDNDADGYAELFGATLYAASHTLCPQYAEEVEEFMASIS